MVKAFKLLLCCTFICTISHLLAAQNKDEIVLTVFGEGTTYDNAVTSALRSAIEQVCGTFISSRTDIISDILVKDEIASISSGNIKSYKILSTTQTNGMTSIYVQVIISLNHFAKYIESNISSSIDFSGQLLGNELTFIDLNRRNEQVAISHLEKQLLSYNDLFDFKISVSEPRLYSAFNKRLNNGGNGISYSIASISVNSNAKLYDFSNTLFNTLSSLSCDDNEANKFKTLGVPYFTLTIQNPDDGINSRVLRKYNFRSQQSLGSIIKILTHLERESRKFIIEDGTHNQFIIGVEPQNTINASYLRMSENSKFFDEYISISSEYDIGEYQGKSQETPYINQTMDSQLYVCIPFMSRYMYHIIGNQANGKKQKRNKLEIFTCFNYRLELSILNYHINNIKQIAIIRNDMPYPTNFKTLGYRINQSHGQRMLQRTNE